MNGMYGIVVVRIVLEHDKYVVGKYNKVPQSFTLTNSKHFGQTHKRDGQPLNRRRWKTEGGAQRALAILKKEWEAIHARPEPYWDPTLQLRVHPGDYNVIHSWLTFCGPVPLPVDN